MVRAFTLIFLALSSTACGYSNFITPREITNQLYTQQQLFTVFSKKNMAISRADLRYAIAQGFATDVNALFVLAKLQHEGSLLEGTRVMAVNRNYAMGFRIKNTSTLGFSNQVYFGVRCLKGHVDSPTGYAFAHDKGRFPANPAVEAVYRYTPYWYIKKSCGEYGNVYLDMIYRRYKAEMAEYYVESEHPLRSLYVMLRRPGYGRYE